jgi:hypothetical protein
MHHTARRQVLVAVLVIVSLSFSGCLTLNASVTADTGDSTVFKQVSVSESWSSQKVRVNATLRSSPAAGNVTHIAVIQSNGEVFSTSQVASGQTTVLLFVPANQNATLVASNTVNSTTLDTLNISVSGDKLI